MNLNKLPEQLDLGEYGQSRRQVSPRTDGCVYNGLGLVDSSTGQRGLTIGGTFFLVHITIPNADPEAYRRKKEGGLHMKHFHLTLSRPGVQGSSHHFHYSSRRGDDGKVVPLQGIVFRPEPGGRLFNGYSDWNSQILEASPDNRDPVKRQRVRRWRLYQLDMMATAFLERVKPA